jgi:hypothetical protein
MAQDMMDPGKITDYHAHVYYDAGSRARAEELRGALERGFEVVMGRWRDAPVGPHPQAMYQVKFSPEVFGRIVPADAQSGRFDDPHPSQYRRRLPGSRPPCTVARRKTATLSRGATRK